MRYESFCKASDDIIERLRTTGLESPCVLLVCKENEKGEQDTVDLFMNLSVSPQALSTETKFYLVESEKIQGQEVENGHIYVVGKGKPFSSAVEPSRVVDVLKEITGEMFEIPQLSYSDKTNLCYWIKKERIMVFIKGEPSNPRCGFTAQLLDLLDEHGIEQYGYFDILSNEKVRNQLKVFSNWPTFPQIYKDGVFLGGIDVVRDALESDPHFLD